MGIFSELVEEKKKNEIESKMRHDKETFIHEYFERCSDEFGYLFSLFYEQNRNSFDETGITFKAEGKEVIFELDKVQCWAHLVIPGSANWPRVDDPYAKEHKMEGNIIYDYSNKGYAAAIPSETFTMLYNFDKDINANLTENFKNEIAEDLIIKVCHKLIRHLYNLKA